jgi:hypothetical protein
MTQVENSNFGRMRLPINQKSAPLAKALHGLQKKFTAAPFQWNGLFDH